MQNQQLALSAKREIAAEALRLGPEIAQQGELTVRGYCLLIQIGGRSKALDERNGTGVGVSAF